MPMHVPLLDFDDRTVISVLIDQGFPGGLCLQNDIVGP